jgi:hypothetical protein
MSELTFLYHCSPNNRTKANEMSTYMAEQIIKKKRMESVKELKIIYLGVRGKEARNQILFLFITI